MRTPRKNAPGSNGFSRAGLYGFNAAQILGLRYLSMNSLRQFQKCRHENSNPGGFAASFA